MAVIVRISLLHLNSGLDIRSFASYNESTSSEIISSWVRVRIVPEDPEEIQP